MGAEGPGDPLHGRSLFHQRPLRVEVVHVFRPVLNGRIAKARIFSDVEFDAAGVQVGHVVLRCGAALDKVQVRALIHDNQGVLELSRASGVEAEVGLQRNLHRDALRDVHKGAAGPHRAVQRRELVVGGRHELHEMLVNHLGVLAGQRALQVGVDHALVRHFLPHVVIDKFGIVLRADAGQRLALSLRDAQLFKSVLDIVRDLFPGALHAGVGADIGRNVIHIQSVHRRSPVRNRDLFI